MSNIINRPDDGRRHMAKLKCPVCGKRVIDFSDTALRRESALCEYTKARGDVDMVITCPNRACGADIAVCIKTLHQPRTNYVSVPIIGTVIS